MPVVSAGVHLARVLGAVGHVVRFLNGEAVHVGAQQHAAGCRSPGAGVPQRDHTRVADARPHVVAERAQPLRHERSGAGLFEPELGVLVQIAAGGDEGGAVDGGKGGHEAV